MIEGVQLCFCLVNIIYQYMRHKAQGLEVIIHALNGAEDHVHMVATIPPKLAVAKFIGQVKGVASTRFNKEHKEHLPFFWQTNYDQWFIELQAT
ncbi:MAG: hypothetical protein DWQ04_31415 [Chloroflexi bacterium]|nr:MAG: hypothetical protein DWQ04_31415 [Chloroflexota bacterium]